MVERVEVHSVHSRAASILNPSLSIAPAIIETFRGQDSRCTERIRSWQYQSKRSLKFIGLERRLPPLLRRYSHLPCLCLEVFTISGIFLQRHQAVYCDHLCELGGDNLDCLTMFHTGASLFSLIFANLVEVDSCNFSLFSIEDLGNLFESRAAGLKVQEVDEDEFECNPALDFLSAS